MTVDTAIEWGETPTGRKAWRVRSHAQIKQLMEDRRLAMNHPDPSAQQWFSDSPMHRVMVRLAARPIPDRRDDSVERARRRASMTRIFSNRNLHRAVPDVRAMAGRLLDAMAAGPNPVDLRDAYSVPLCALVICELIDVPTEDMALFRRWSDDKDSADPRRSLGSMRELMRYTSALVERRRAEPGDDIVSALLATDAEDDEFHEGRITTLVAWILGLGWQVAASAIDYGTMMLTAHPDQLEIFLADPSVRASAVEEVLRMFNATSAAIGGLDRYAHEEIQIDGVTIKPGDMVLLDVPAANHDETMFPRPDDFDIRRTPNPHLTFGHGFYFCNFNRVARAEVEVGLTTLFERLPGLRLAVDPAELTYTEHPQSGVVRLPVSW